MAAATARTRKWPDPHETSLVRVLVLGAGSVGSVVGGFLAKAGHDVVLVGRAAHMDAIRNAGLHISGIWGEHHIGTLHNAIADYRSDEPRLMKRCQVMADRIFDPAFVRDALAAAAPAGASAG